MEKNPELEHLERANLDRQVMDLQEKVKSLKTLCWILFGLGVWVLLHFWSDQGIVTRLVQEQSRRLEPLIEKLETDSHLDGQERQHLQYELIDIQSELDGIPYRNERND